MQELQDKAFLQGAPRLLHPLLPPNAFQIEMLLDAVVRACPTKPCWINKGIHSSLESELNQTAKRCVYLILLDIVENVKYRGLKISGRIYSNRSS